jgi:succinate dehydrogenase/fumarate reductase cytochrome b subunit
MTSSTAVADATRALHVSGVLFSLYLATHLLNAVAVLWGGREAYDGILGRIRGVLRWHWAVEFLLAQVLVCHVASALWLARERRKRKQPRPRKDSKKGEAQPPSSGGALGTLRAVLLFPVDCTAVLLGELRTVADAWVLRRGSISSRATENAANRVAGFVLTGIVCFHVLFTRVLPAVVGHRETVFDEHRFTLLNWPVPFYAYLTLYGSCGVAHMLFGIRHVLERLGVVRASNKGPRLIALAAGVGAVLIFLSALTMGGKLGSDADGDHDVWKAEFESFADALGVSAALQRVLLPWKQQ